LVSWAVARPLLINANRAAMLTGRSRASGEVLLRRAARHDPA